MSTAEINARVRSAYETVMAFDAETMGLAKKAGLVDRRVYDDWRSLRP